MTRNTSKISLLHLGKYTNIHNEYVNMYRILYQMQHVLTFRKETFFLEIKDKSEFLSDGLSM